MNWGEPWYAGFRESQTEYRLKNQAYFQRNMMPGMLGWFQMRPETSMEDIDNEFHLERVADSSWNLFQVHSSTYRLEGRDRQPGEPAHQTFSFQNPEAGQTLRFLLTAEGGEVGGIRMELDGVRRVDLPVSLAEGETLAYRGGEQATVYSSGWRALRSIPVDAALLHIATGAHELVMDADLVADGGQLKVELRIWGEGELVSGR